MRSKEEIEELLAMHLAKHEPGWSKGYRHFSGIINRLGLKVGVEVGVAFGGHSEAILKNTKVEKLYGVDPFTYSYDYEEQLNFDQSELDVFYGRTKKRLNHFGERFELVRQFSHKAVREIPDGLDFVYIDADHSFIGCLMDIRFWFSKIKTGGIIGGHDYKSRSFLGVTRAVDGVFGSLDLEVNYEGDGCWWVVKKDNPKTTIWTFGINNYLFNILILFVALCLRRIKIFLFAGLKKTKYNIEEV